MNDLIKTVPEYTGQDTFLSKSVSRCAAPQPEQIAREQPIMVRFELFDSPNRDRVSSEGRTDNRESEPCSSLRLAVLSPDRRLMYSLISRRYIAVRKLPLEEADEDPPLSRFELPSHVCDALKIDEPKELLVADGVRQSHEKIPKDDYTFLCLYTQCNAFLIKLPDVNSQDTDTIPESHVTEPLEEFLDHFDDDKKIVRIRGAPQAHSLSTSVTQTPRGSFAALVELTKENQYILFLYHRGNHRGCRTCPLKFGLEDPEGKGIVDFCFAESGGLSLISSTTVLLLQETGDVLSASPIVFDGMQIHSRHLDETLEYLDKTIDASDHIFKSRQCKAARYFFQEVFERTSGNSKVVTAKLLMQSASQGSAYWPIKIQGPVYHKSSSDASAFSSVGIETFDSTDCLVGVAIAKECGTVEFVGLSPTSLLPRFIHESDEDGYQLDNLARKSSALVEKVALDLPTGSLCMLQDHHASNLLHIISRVSVSTISTNAMIFTTKLISGLSNDSLSTSAWGSLRCTPHEETILGVAISSDPIDGHKVVAQLSSGSLVSADITRSKYDRDLSTLFSPAEKAGSHSGDNMLRLPPPLYEELGPCLSRIKTGLEGLERLVGSSTNYKEITTEALAWVNQRLDQCSKEIVIPVQELNKSIDASVPKLKDRLDGQRSQVRALTKQLEESLSRLKKLEHKIQMAEDNATLLSNRSMKLYQVAEQLAPTLTGAEMDFFRSIDRLARKTTALEKLGRAAKEAVETSCLNLEEGVTISFTPEEMQQINLTLKGSGKAQQIASHCLQHGSPTKKAQS